MSEHIIYLNFASAEELQLIPNVGPVIADAIIALRDSRGSLDQGTLETLMRTKLDSAVLQILDFRPNINMPVRRPSAASALRAEEEGLGSVHTSGRFQHSGQMESSQDRLKGPDQTSSAHGQGGAREKGKSRNVLMSSLSKKTITQQVSEDPRVHFQDVKPNIPDLD